MALLTFMKLTLFRDVCSDKIQVVNIPNVAQLAKMVLMCHLCGSSVAYSHHRVALFGKKASQERLPSRISTVEYNVE